MVLIVTIAFLAMLVQDIFGVLMVQAEGRGWGWRSGFMDGGMWICGLATNHYALNALDSHNQMLKVMVVIFVTMANVVGSKLGQHIGDRYFPDPSKLALSLLQGQYNHLVTWAISQGYVLPAPGVLPA